MMFGRHQNPFDKPYLTEGTTSPSELLAQYSFLPIKHVFQKISPKENVLLIGRRGVGKTMILRLFDADMVAEIYREARTPGDAHDYLLEGSIGTYLNLASPIFRLNEFSGRGRDSGWWARAFADYFGYLALEAALRGCRALTSLPGWRAANRWKGTSVDTGGVDRSFAQHFSALPGLEGVDSFNGLQRSISRRLSAWIQFLNRDSETPPIGLVQIADPLYALAAALGTSRKDIRLLLLLDQYEVLHSLSGRLDLRPLFNEAMYAASRGGTGVEFKIGTRRYSYGDLKLFGSQTGLEDGREISFADLDEVAVKYFPGFAAELLAKRLDNAQVPIGPRLAKTLAQHYLPALAAADEGERLVANARETSRRSIEPYLRAWAELGVPPNVTETVARAVFAEHTSPLISALTALYLTHWLARSAPRLPKWGGTAEGAPLETKLRKLGVLMRDALSSRYRNGTVKARASAVTRAADDLISSWEDAALFQLASTFKNQRKHFTGFATISRVSSNVALVFLQIMRTAWEYHSLRSSASPSGPIAPDIQSEAIYTVSREWALRIGREYEQGVIQDRFLKGLGGSLRAIQMSPFSTVPAPNGFSTEFNDPSPGQLLLGATGDRNLLNMLVSSGLLEESEHQDKTRGRPRRRKYYVNRILCPYFAITEKHIKDPFYVSELSEFVGSLTRGEQPVEVKRLLLPREEDTAQVRLF